MIKLKIIVSDAGEYIDTEIVAKPTHIDLDIQVLTQEKYENEL
tara:strand:+ start:1690 stop:1818 length:129 start_codon:yes stop_codon:yes gene_type:complete